MIWCPTSFAERIGAALAAPTAALSAADDPAHAGRASSDATAVLLASAFALHVRALVAAAWIGAVDSALAGVVAAAGVVGRAIGWDLAFLFIAGGVVTIAAGRRRAVGRDFDLAAVAYVPFAFVRLIAGFAAALAGGSLPRAATDVAGVAALAWGGGAVALAIRVARARGDARG